MPAPIANKNAVKPRRECAGAHLHLRVGLAEKLKWQRAAKLDRVTLATWTRRRLNK